jgi:hypothetical protein
VWGKCPIQFAGARGGGAAAGARRRAARAHGAVARGCGSPTVTHIACLATAMGRWD